MNRVAVFVDVGYFWVQVGTLLSGKYTSRGKCSMDYERLREKLLTEVSTQFPGVALLRIYWYDGPGSNGKTSEHLSIDNLDDFKLRLGTRNGVGQQKGVDGLIIADLISLTQQKSISHALLVSGDSDIAPGVIAAQSMGLRVHLLSIGSSNATSPILRAEVDFKRYWRAEDVSSFASEAAKKNAPPTSPVIGVSPSGAPQASQDNRAHLETKAKGPTGLDDLVIEANKKIKVGKNSVVYQTLDANCDSLPREIDGELLSFASERLGRILSIPERRDIRIKFLALLSTNKKGSN